MKKTYDLVSSMLVSMEFLMKEVEDITDDKNLRQEIRELRIAAKKVLRRAVRLSAEIYFKNEMEKYGGYDDFMDMDDEEFNYFTQARAKRRGGGR